MSEKIVQLNEEVIKGQLKELVRGSKCCIFMQKINNKTIYGSPR